jgi:RND family efflux transporter MFP subunit
MADFIEVAPGTALAGPGGKPEWAMSRRERERAILARHGLAPRRRWPWLLALVVVLAAAGALGWRWWQERQAAGGASEAATEAEAAPEDAAALPVQINRTEWAGVEPVTLRRTVEVIGPLAPARRVDLSAQASGEVQDVAVRPGDAAARGQVLVQLDEERLTLELDLARANAESTQTQLDTAQAQLDRARSLVERGVAAETTLEDLENNVASLRASLAAQEDQVAAAELSLSNASVTAPFDGVVASRAVDPGAVVAQGAALLSLVDLSEVEMLASAPVAAGARIRPGQTVEVEVDGIEGRTFRGEVQRVAPVAEEGTRTLTIYVRLANPDGMLLGGMFATGRIVTEERVDAVAVPEAAVQEDEAGSFVFVLEGGALARRDVEAGEVWEGNLLEVTGGLAPGDEVVTSALSGLAPGRPVELVEF